MAFMRIIYYKTFLSFRNKKNVVLFLNSHIGKIPNLQVASFLKKLRRTIHADDELLIGFDLRKNIEML